MIYELAKQLKDAGFVQGGKGAWIVSPDNLVSRHEDRVYVPTLEELIEACVHFNALSKELPHSWIARANWITRPENLHYLEMGHGLTPTEAVARLWLALHKNTTSTNDAG
jgi:hypothetical protein